MLATTMRYDAEHKEKTRTRIVKEAASAIRLEGPHRVAVAEIMGRAGLTHGGFYAHFASKDDLVAQAIEQLFVEAQGRFDEFGRGRTPAEGLIAYIDFYLSEQHRDHRERGCPMPGLSADVPRLGGAAQQAFERGLARITAALAERIAASGGRDPDMLAVSMLSELVGAVALARSIADPHRSAQRLDATRKALLERLGLAQAT